jgi:hypothetical protein
MTATMQTTTPARPNRIVARFGAIVHSRATAAINATMTVPTMRSARSLACSGGAGRSGGNGCGGVGSVMAATVVAAGSPPILILLRGR